MADEEGFYFEVEFLSFLQKWIKTEILFENFDSKASQGHAEVLDQSIGLLHPTSHCYNLDTRDMENTVTSFQGHFVPSHFSSSVGHLVPNKRHFVPKVNKAIKLFSQWIFPKIRS